jgi:hypothetical protein
VDSSGELKTIEREVNRRPDVCVIIIVMLNVLQLFVATTSEDPINRFTNPNPRLSHPNT